MMWIAVGLPFKTCRICLWGLTGQSINEVNRQLDAAANLIFKILDQVIQDCICYKYCNNI